MHSRTRLRIKTTPKELRDAANRLEAELKNVVIRGQEAEVDFASEIVLYSGKEPTGYSAHAVTSEDQERHARVTEAFRAESNRPMLN